MKYIIFTDETLKTLAVLVIRGNYKDYKKIINYKDCYFLFRLRNTDSIKPEMFKTNFGDSNMWVTTLPSDFKDSIVRNLP
jgi:hypothetical protein